jgi:hypothetical protein
VTDIGKPERKIKAYPLKSPIPKRIPEEKPGPEPERVPEPREPEGVPA